MNARRERTEVMLAKPFSQHLLDRMPDRVILQPKLNGIRVVAKYLNGCYKLFSSTGREMMSLPHIVEDLNYIAREQLSLGRDVLSFDGEVWNPRVPLQDIQSITSKTTCVDEYADTVDYHIFDLLTKACQEDRLLELALTISETQCVKKVETHIVHKERWTRYLTSYIDSGYEGIIIRDPAASYSFGKQSCILKVKPRQMDSYTITGCEEAISIEGTQKGMIGALDLIDSLGNHFQAGAGKLTHLERTEWWERRAELPGKLAVVKYLELTSRGVPREPVTIEIKEALDA